MTARWTPATEQDIVDAIRNGTLKENHHLEVKQSANNESIAATLASLAIDGGTFLLGIEEIKHSAGNKSLQAKPLLTEGQQERIDQIARNSVEPALWIRSIAIPSSADPAKGYIVVTVEPSPEAPHMAGKKYYGRGETSKHALGDADVLRFHQLREQLNGLGTRLLDLEEERDYIAPDDRKHGHIYIVAEPVMPIQNGVRLSELIEDGSVYEIVTKGAASAPVISPGPGTANVEVPRSNGIAFVSFHANGDGRTPNPDAAVGFTETNLLDIEVTDRGGFRVFIGRGTDGRDDQMFIADFMAVGYLQHLMHWISKLAGELKYGGSWTLGVRAKGLRGLKSSKSLEYGRTYGAMDADTYERVTVASTAEINDHPNRVVHTLIGNYLRTLGTEGHYTLDK